MLLELLATLCAALFTGAALYVNLVEHPARLSLGTRIAVQEWRPSYARGTLMQASLATAGLLAAVGAWLQGRGTAVLVAGLLLGSVVPFTLVVIFPTNRQLEDPALDAAAPTTRALLDRWNRLHAVRSTLALLGLILFLLHLSGAAARPSPTG